MARKLLEIAASIAKAQASVNKISPEEIERTLMKTFHVLQRMQDAEQQGVLLQVSDDPVSPAPQEKLSEHAAPRNSIHENRIICLECGIEMKQLTRRHLGLHGLNQRDYKKKWGFSMRTPLSAKSLSRARSRAAKQRGLPPNLVKFQQERKGKAARKATLSQPSST